ncbi:hypothetical protein A8F94_00895 [Bacillus sp. FJAT-27225]|uniref:hypothetical protein n=1 Tax=Bacillus sp. FJAT-27225 TaxID=1743144 RepID=UPI00080C2F4C|nr:hypothetical protein [Bacillus sp. FJAT-27225]OCA90478.1 hypothetical protein A8F94_00895 [Bacillus sp. FJAT-27225]
MKKRKLTGLESMNFDYGQGDWDLKDISSPKTNHYQRQSTLKPISKGKTIASGLGSGIIVAIAIIFFVLKFGLNDVSAADVTGYLNKIFTLQNQAYTSLNEVQRNYTLQETNSFLQDLDQKDASFQQSLSNDLSKMKVPKGFEQYHQLATHTLLDISLILHQYRLNKQSGIKNTDTINQLIFDLNNNKVSQNQELIRVFDSKHISYTLRPDGTISSYSVKQ